jgi:hypothetical protein
MAMTKCKECGVQISTKADACPQCGAKRKRTSGCAVVILGFLLIFLLLPMIATRTITGNGAVQTSADTFGSSRSSADVPPKVQLVEQTQAVPQKTASTPGSDPLKGLSKEYDKMRGITWYKSPSSPKHANSNGFYLYFGKEDSGHLLPLRLVVRYVSVRRATSGEMIF